MVIDPGLKDDREAWEPKFDVIKKDTEVLIYNSLTYKELDAHLDETKKQLKRKEG